MTISHSPTLPEVLNALRDGIFRDLHVAMPGRVESFDAVTNTADVQPMVREIAEGPDGAPVPRALGILTGVPVMFPGGGGLRITFPIAQGDMVLLVFTDRSIDAFLNQGTESAPVDQRRHALPDAVAYPGLRPSPTAWTNIEAGVVTIGQDSAGSSDFVALAAKVNARLAHLEAAFNAHTHGLAAVVPTGLVAPSGGGPVTGSIGPLSTASPDASINAIPVETASPGSGVVGSVASATVKVRG